MHRDPSLRSYYWTHLLISRLVILNEVKNLDKISAKETRAEMFRFAQHDGLGLPMGLQSLSGKAYMPLGPET